MITAIGVVIDVVCQAPHIVKSDKSKMIIENEK